MTLVPIALANVRFPLTPEHSWALAIEMIELCGTQRRLTRRLPGVFRPGYRVRGKTRPPPDQEFLERAWSVIAAAAGRARVGVVLGTERVMNGALLATALVIQPDGTRAGFQDKVQLDPSEEGTYTAGTSRHFRWVRSSSVSSSVTRAGVTPRPCAGPRGAARRSSFILSSTKPSRADSGQRRSAIPETPSTRRPCSVRGAENTCLLRDRQLRVRRLAHDVGDRCSGRDAARASTVRTGRAADRRHRPHGCNRAPRLALQAARLRLLGRTACDGCARWKEARGRCAGGPELTRSIYLRAWATATSQSAGSRT